MKTKTILASIAFAMFVSVPVSAQYKYAWQNPNLPRAERVENLLGMLTPEEKVGLMMNKSVSIDRLGIPSYNWWSEACHGVRQGGYTASRHSVIQLVERGLSWCSSGRLYRLSPAYRYGGCIQCPTGI